MAEHYVVVPTTMSHLVPKGGDQEAAAALLGISQKAMSKLEDVTN